MSTAARKTPNKPIEPEVLTETMKIARLETATETMMAYVGYLTNQILDEENSPSPNLAKIEVLREQKQAVLAERRSMSPDNEKLIARAIYVYAPIMKALYGQTFQLSEEEHKQRYAEIERDSFEVATPVDKPRIVVTGGQPGSGKVDQSETGSRNI